MLIAVFISLRNSGDEGEGAFGRQVTKGDESNIIARGGKVSHLYLFSILTV